MKSIVLPEYNPNLVRAIRSLSIEELAVPEPGASQVLIRVEMTPCNPSDIAFIRGMYNFRRKSPVVPGFEATGEVVSAGVMREARDLLGNRVSCFIQDENLQGTWSEYLVTHWQDCIELRRDIPLEQAATLCINPFTAYALFETAKKRGAGAFIQNAASGQVGQFLRNLAHAEGIRTINLVRKQEQVEELQREGEEYVLNVSGGNFEEQLSGLAREMNATVAFDAVGGETSGAIFNALPPGSQLILYGGLSGQQLSKVETMDLIFKDKSIAGFNLGDWKQAIGHQRFLDIALELQDMILDGLIGTRVQGVYELEKIQDGLAQYIRNMSKGKVFFKP